MRIAGCPPNTAPDATALGSKRCRFTTKPVSKPWYLKVSEELGVFAVDVRATDEQGGRSYLKYDFVPLQDVSLHLYLPLATAGEMFGK
jgi:hypothetical protein